MWNFVLADLAGIPLGEIKNASDRKVSLPLNRMATASFTIPLEHRHADRVLQGDCLVKAYETVGRKYDNTIDRRLRFVGEVTTAEEVAESDSGTVAVTAADGLWRLLHRHVGKVDSFPNALSSPLTLAGNVDRGTIVKEMVNSVNDASQQPARGSTGTRRYFRAPTPVDQDSGGPTGVVMGTIQPSSTLFDFGPLRWAKVAEQITALSSALDGFDFELVPIDNTPGTFWRLDIYGAKGTTRDSAIFEYGTGKRNVRAYRRPVTKDQIMNDGTILPPGFPDNAIDNPQRIADDASILAIGRYEDFIASDLVSADLRGKLLEEHIRIRKQPRQVITFDPQPSAPKFGTHYFNGDLVRFRAMRNGNIRINGIFRVYGADISISNEGRGETSIQVTPS